MIVKTLLSLINQFYWWRNFNFIPVTCGVAKTKHSRSYPIRLKLANIKNINLIDI